MHIVAASSLRGVVRPMLFMCDSANCIAVCIFIWVCMDDFQAVSNLCVHGAV